jgi:glycosyltransferase involved in cell wall biosynthesis
LGIAPYVSEILASRHVRRFEVMSETGIESLPELAPRVGSEGPVRLLYVGRIVRTKGLRDAIRALKQVHTALPPTLDVVGDGFDRTACEALVADLGLSSQVRFHGFLPRAEVDTFYRAADIFVFPSYQEPGGNVVFEAMGFGLPVVVSDRGGPGNVVDENCGFRVHPDNPDQFARELAVAITRLVEDPALRARLGAGARTHVAKIALWDAKIDRLDALYAETVATAHARLSRGASG